MYEYKLYIKAAPQNLTMY